MGRIARSQHFIQRARADAGEQDHHVELAAKQPLGECERFGIVFDRSFAHGGRDERVATLAADQFGDFSCAPALEGKDAQAIEGHQYQRSARTRACRVRTPANTSWRSHECERGTQECACYAFGCALS